MLNLSTHKIFTIVKAHFYLALLFSSLKSNNSIHTLFIKSVKWRFLRHLGHDEPLNAALAPVKSERRVSRGHPRRGRVA